MKNIIDILNKGNEAERSYAVQDIGKKCDPEMSLPLIQRLMVEDSQLLKDAIVFTLMKMPCYRIYDNLFKMFDSPDAFLRNSAVSIFGSEKGEVIAFLTSHLNHANREIRKLILDSLYLTGTSEAILAIRAGLHDPSINVQITAAEYLGMLEDQASADDLIELLEKNDEPMLCFAILEALSCIGDKDSISRVISVLGSVDDINTIEPIYIPGVIRMAAKSGDLDFICKVFETIDDISSYADDIMRAVGETKRRFENILEECCILDMTKTMLMDTELRENIRHNAAEILLGDEKELLDKKELFVLGNDLVSQASMIYPGVRFLARSENPSALIKIKKIMAENKDEELRSLCEELIENLSDGISSEDSGGQ